MFHIVLAIASRFLYFGNALQGFARAILTLRNLSAISSHLIPAICPPPPIALLDAPVHFVGLPEEIIPPFPSAGLIALERIERQPPPFTSPISSYQSSLITVSSSQLPIFLPLFIIMLATISGFVIVLPEVLDFFMSLAKLRNITNFVRSKLVSHLLPVGDLFLWVIGPIVAVLQWCGLLVVQDTQTPPLLNAIYEQITRCAAGYKNFVDCGDMTYDFVEDQVAADGSRYPDFAHDQIPEEYMRRLQSIYTQFVDSQDCFREQLDLSRAHQLELQADLLAAEHERERLVSKRRGAKARCAEAEVTVSKLRADLATAMDHLDRQTEVTSSKDQIIQSITEKSQVAHVRLKYAEDKITQLNAKLQHERDRRHRKTKELLEEQVRVQDLYASNILRLKQEAQDAQEQIDSLMGAMSELRADDGSPLDHDHSTRYRQPTTRPYEPPLPPERVLSPTTNAPCTPSRGRDDSSTLLNPTSEVIQDHRVALKKLFERMREEEYDSPPLIHGTPPISTAINVNSSLFSTKSSPHTPSQDREGSSTHKDSTSGVAQDHWVALRKLFGRMREEEDETCQPPTASECIRDAGQEGSSTHQNPTWEVTQDHSSAPEKSFERNHQGEHESAQDGVEPDSEQQESRLQDELAVTKEQLSADDEDSESREIVRELKSHVTSLRFEWEMCRAMLREAQDAQCSCMTDLARVLDLLHVSQAEWEESQFECSQVRFFCAALQERVTELEAEVEGSRSKELECRPAVTPVDTDPESPFFFAPSDDFEAITYEYDLELQDSDSIYMTIPPLLPRLLDISLPTPSSPFSSSSSLYLDDEECSLISPTRSGMHPDSLFPTDSDDHSIVGSDPDSYLDELSLALQSCDFNLTHHYEIGLGKGNGQDVQQSAELVRSSVDPGSATPELTNLDHLLPPSSPSSEGVSRLVSPPYRAFLSEGNSLGSMDWPPIGSALSPGSGNVRQEREQDGLETEEVMEVPILSYQETLIQESEPVLDRDRRDPNPPISSRSSIITPDSPPILNSPHREITYSSRQDRCIVTNASPKSSSHRDVPIRPPYRSPLPPSNLPPPGPPLLGLLDSATIDSVSGGTDHLRHGRRRPNRFGFLHDISVPKLDYDLPADFVPRFRRTASKPLTVDSDIDEFAFLIPLDCQTSTPAAAVAARRRTGTLAKGPLGSGSGGTDLHSVDSSLPRRFLPRKRLPLQAIENSPGPWVRRPNQYLQAGSKLRNVKGKERMLVQEASLC